jgi:hypothetical protein
MRALARIAATLSALGIAPADINMLTRMGGNRRTIIKHAFNKSTRGAGKRSRCRLQIARGAGSISAKADILQLCRQGKWNDAANMDQEHEHQCGERLFGPEIRAQWRSYAVEEALTS